MVKLRLRRMGRKKRPFYRIVAIESSKRRDGRYIENIGTYNPVLKVDSFLDKCQIDHEVALKWLLCGAQPSDTVKRIFSADGIMLKYDMTRRFKKHKDGSKVKTVKDENGNPVRLYTDEQVQEAYENWKSNKK